ncbi:MAG: hypothetical protein ABIO46_11220 [Chitinophagales bacterium]
MKIFVTILLVCFFAFDSIGIYFLFDHEIFTAKSEAHESMRSPSKELVTITISKKSCDLPWWIGTHEFRYHNQMYDVVGIVEKKNEVIYTCYHDEHEESVVSDLLNHVKDVADPVSSRHSSRKLRREFDKYFSNQQTAVMNDQFVFGVAPDNILLPHDLFYRNTLTQPPNSVVPNLL